MRKILSFVLLLTMLLQASVFAETLELGAAMDTDCYNVYISGKTDMTSKPVSIVLVKDNDEIGHVGELFTDKDGNYETKFRFNHPLDGYSVLVRDSETAKDLTSTVKTAFARQDLYSLDLNISNSGNDVIGYISEKDALNVAVSINNKYGDKTNVSVIFASYGENNVLLGTEIKNLTVGYRDLDAQKTVDFTDFKLPVGTKYVKAFAWVDAINLIPLAKEDVKEKRENVAFTNDNPANTKVIGIVGDSISAHGNYVAFLDNYYYSKYPDSNIVILNKGISGDSANGINKRLEWDIFNENDPIGYGACDEITVMIGMNDVGYTTFNKGPQDDYEAAYPNKLSAIQSCLDNIEKIVIYCKENNKPITLVTPSLYDESDRFISTLSGGTKYGTNWALGKVAEGVKEFGKKYDVPVLDLYKASNEYSDRIRAEYPAATTVITGTDGIHPDAKGGYLFGYLFARAQETNEYVANVEIDASADKITAENATVTDVDISADSVSYTYLPKSLPIYDDSRYNYVKDYGVDILNHMNKEIIKVSNLDDGKYTIELDGAVVGTYTASQLEEGVNIAEIANNPNHAVAKIMSDAIASKGTGEKDLRSDAMVEARFRNGGGAEYRPEGISTDFDNFTTDDWINYAKALRANYEATTPQAEWSDSKPVNGIVSYITRKESHDSNLKLVKDALATISTIKPIAYNVVITKTDDNDMKFGGDTQQIKVAFIGDSITHMAYYLKGIEHYYHTRYPDKDIVFVNKGVSGNGAPNVINRFGWDITEDEISGKIDEVTMMLGRNDVGAKNYEIGSTATKEQKDAKIATFITNVEKIIKLCNDAGIRLTIITPSLTDDTEGFATPSANEPECNTYGLKNIAEKVTALAKQYDVPVIDFWTPTTEVTNYVRETFGYDGVVITGTDRVHPKDQGGTYMAYQFVKQQDGDPIVAKVQIDAVNKTKTTRKATVALTSVTPTRVEYEYLPKAIPFAYTSYYKLFEATWGVPITEDINQEIIKVTGLTEGTYKITIGGSTLSRTYTSSELAEGVNIAIDEKNPAQAQAKSAYNLANTKVTNESTYRSIAITEQQLKDRGYEASQFNENSTTEELKVLGAWTGNFANYFSLDANNYGSKKYEVENWAKIRTQEQEARNAAKPVQRTVVIEKQ